MSLLALCNRTATIKRPTTTAQSGGGQVKVFNAVYSDVRCRLHTASGRTIEAAGKRQMTVTHDFYAQGSYSVRSGDVIDIGTERYQIQWGGDMGGQGSHFHAAVLRVDQ